MESSKETEQQLPQQEGEREEVDTILVKDQGGENRSFDVPDNAIPPLPLSPPPRASLIVEDTDPPDIPTSFEDSLEQQKV